MGRGKSITLKGAAAGAFVSMLRGDPPKTEEDDFLRYATLVHMEMKVGNTDNAVKLLKELVALKAPKPGQNQRKPT